MASAQPNRITASGVIRHPSPDILTNHDLRLVDRLRLRDRQRDFDHLTLTAVSVKRARRLLMPELRRLYPSFTPRAVSTKANHIIRALQFQIYRAVPHHQDMRWGAVPRIGISHPVRTSVTHLSDEFRDAIYAASKEFHRHRFLYLYSRSDNTLHPTLSHRVEAYRMLKESFVHSSPSSSLLSFASELYYGHFPHVTMDIRGQRRHIFYPYDQHMSGYVHDGGIAFTYWGSPAECPTPLDGWEFWNPWIYAPAKKTPVDWCEVRPPVMLQGKRSSSGDPSQPVINVQPWVKRQKKTPDQSTFETLLTMVDRFPRWDPVTRLLDCTPCLQGASLASQAWLGVSIPEGITHITIWPLKESGWKWALHEPHNPR